MVSHEQSSRRGGIDGRERRVDQGRAVRDWGGNSHEGSSSQDSIDGRGAMEGSQGGRSNSLMAGFLTVAPPDGGDRPQVRPIARAGLFPNPVPTEFAQGVDIRAIHEPGRSWDQLG